MSLPSAGSLGPPRPSGGVEPDAQTSGSRCRSRVQLLTAASGLHQHENVRTIRALQRCAARSGRAVVGDIRGRLAADIGDYALTRLRSRRRSSIVDAAAAALLEEFRTPKTIVEAVIRYSQHKGLDPEATLEGAFPLLQRLIERRLLVTPGSEAESDSRPMFARGDSIIGPW